MVFTSYFGNRELWGLYDELKICIAQKSPLDSMTKCDAGLIPSKDLVYAYKYKGLSEEGYIKRYYEENLSKLNPEDIYDKYNGKILMCYCGGFCHRHVIAYWLNSNGFECKEFGKEGTLDELRKHVVLPL